MLRFCSVAVLSVSILNPGASFMTFVGRHHARLDLSRQTTLFSKKTGGGIPYVAPGDCPGECLLFDPEEQGKLQGTGSLRDRIKQRADYKPTPIFDVSQSTPPADVQLDDAQDWLEDIGLPLNFAKPSSPVTATVLASAKIIKDDAPGDIRHVILGLPEGMHYVEGQSLSVIPPGFDQSGKPHKPRLYSIASTRYGDAFNGKTVSLCVRRAEFHDPVSGLPDAIKAGVCSGFLCDAPPGTQVLVAGPVGKTMLLPEDPTRDIIMIATGTGIAPFRAFLHRLFMENTVQGHMFQGTAWLVLGVPVTGGLLYHDEFEAMKNRAHPGQFKVDYAISREMKNAEGGKLYVQDVIEQNSVELFNRIDNGANVYFCGLKAMMPPILETLAKVAAHHGIVWEDKMKELKANHQWHVEVY